MNSRVSIWENKWKKYSEDKIQPGFHKDQVNEFLLKYINKLINVSDKEKLKQSSILVPLCGKTLDLLYLSQFTTVLGIECAQLAIDEFMNENKLVFNDDVLSKSEGRVFEFNDHPIKIGKIDMIELATLFPIFNMPGPVQYICKLLHFENIYIFMSNILVIWIKFLMYKFRG